MAGDQAAVENAQTQVDYTTIKAPLTGRVGFPRPDPAVAPTTDGEVPLSAFAKWTTTPIQPLSISHQGQFPAITLSFNLAQGIALGQATDAIERAIGQLNLPASISTSFQGNALAFRDPLSAVPILILAALVVVYIILGILYESVIHPITSSRPRLQRLWELSRH